MNAEQETDFETWARLLLRRKVPDDFQHLIDQEVVHDGEIILRRGDAFEIHIRPQNREESASHPPTRPENARILLTPLRYPRRRARI